MTGADTTRPRPGERLHGVVDQIREHSLELDTLGLDEQAVGLSSQQRIDLDVHLRGQLDPLLGDHLFDQTGEKIHRRRLVLLFRRDPALSGPAVLVNQIIKLSKYQMACAACPA